jgi:hypothetical protein
MESSEDLERRAASIIPGAIYQVGLAGAVTQALDGYERERKDFHHSCLRLIGEVDDSKFQFLDDLASSLVKGALDLVSPETFANAACSLIQFSRDYDPPDGEPREPRRLRETVVEAMQLALARDGERRLRIGLGRLGDLVMLMGGTAVSPRTTCFLQRVSRAYLYGFDAECAVFCRSALDVEFEAEISIDDCVGVLGTRKPLQFTLDDRIAVAVRLGRIAQEAGEKARAVKAVGNRAVHDKPEMRRPVLELLKQTIEVLGELAVV